MRIAYLANARLPTEKAHGLQVMQMCAAFSLKGHEVTLIVPRRRNPIRATPWDYYGLNPTFKIVEVPIVDLIPHDRLLGRFTLWLNMIQFAFVARQAVEDVRPDVVYCRDPWYAGLAPAGAAYIFEAHDFPSRAGLLHRRAWARCARIVAVTAGLKHRFIESGVAPDKIVVAHDGVEPALFESALSKAEARRSLGLPEGTFMAAYVGLLYPYKGADDVLEACALVRRPLTMVFVGGHDEDIDRLKLRAAALHLADVRFVGRTPHAQIPTYLRAADVAVLPTRAVDRHAAEFLSPLKLFEYLAAGKAIVATDLPSVREVLDERSALFVPPSEPSGLARALDALSTDEQLRQKMELAARDLSLSHTWEQRVDTVLSGMPRPDVLGWVARNRLPLRFAAFAFILRALYVLFVPQAPIFGGDGGYYLNIADGLRGILPSGATLPSFFQPLYPFALAIIRAVFGTSLAWIRIFQAGASAATVFLMVAMAERWVSRRAGTIAGILGALSVPMILESGILYTETLYTLLVTGSIALLLVYLRRPSARAAIATGTVFALAGLTREIGFYLGLTLTATASALRRPRLLAIIMLAPLLLAMGGLVIRNRVVHVAPTETHSPLFTKGYEATFADPSTPAMLLRWRIYPEGLWRFIRYPFRLVDVSDETSTKRIILSGDLRQIVPQAPRIFAKLALIVMHWIILLSAAYGLWKGQLDRRAKIVFAVAIAFAAGTIILSGATRLQGFDYLEPLARYRFPIEPLIMILAASGLARLGRRPGTSV